MITLLRNGSRSHQFMVKYMYHFSNPFFKASLICDLPTCFASFVIIKKVAHVLSGDLVLLV